MTLLLKPLLKLLISNDDDALPSKSKEKYEKAYLDFGKWKKKENTAVTSENVLIAYFKELWRNLNLQLFGQHIPCWNQRYIRKKTLQLKTSRAWSFLWRERLKDTSRNMQKSLKQRKLKNSWRKLQIISI